MTKTLRQAINALMENFDNELFDPIDDTFEMMRNLKNAYQDHRSNMTETSKRIEFLEECLEEGMSKRDAARKLSEHDSRVGRKTAETLVYTNFSGQYQTSKRGRRLNTVEGVPIKSEVVVPDVSDDESIL